MHHTRPQGASGASPALRSASPSPMHSPSPLGSRRPEDASEYLVILSSNNATTNNTANDIHNDNDDKDDIDTFKDSIQSAMRSDSWKSRHFGVADARRQSVGRGYDY